MPSEYVPVTANDNPLVAVTDSLASCAGSCEVRRQLRHEGRDASTRPGYVTTDNRGGVQNCPVRLIYNLPHTALATPVPILVGEDHRQAHVPDKSVMTTPWEIEKKRHNTSRARDVEVALGVYTAPDLARTPYS